MDPRDVFDVVFLVVLAAVVYLEVIGVGFSVDRLQALVGALLGMDLVVYVVIASILGLVFVGTLVLYLPRKYRQQVN